MTNEKTEACPKCQETLIQNVAGQKRCGACGHQWSPNEKPAAKPLGGRRILFEK